MRKKKLPCLFAFVGSHELARCVFVSFVGGVGWLRGWLVAWLGAWKAGGSLAAFACVAWRL